MNKFVIKKHCRPQNLFSLKKKKILEPCTFNISGAKIFGPREENEAILGALRSFTASLFRMVARGSL